MSTSILAKLVHRSLLCCLLALVSAGTEARNPYLSHWIKDISYTNTLEPTGVTWNDEFGNFQVVGKTVHTLWYGRKDDWNDRRFVYRRSTSEGNSWDTPRVIARDSAFPGSSLVADERAQYLCVSGSTVHIVMVRSFPISATRSWYYNLYYSRSTDNGATFEPARKLVAGADVWHITQPNVVCNSKRIVIGYKYAANWYDNYEIRLLISANSGDTFRNSWAVGSDDDSGSFEDLVLSGTDIYVLHYRLLENYYYGNFQARIGVASSVDDGHHFTYRWMTTAAADGRYYALSTKDYYNSPDLAVVGSNVYVIWNQLDTDYNGTKTLMFRRSLDKGQTFSAARTLFKADILASGQETIAAKGNHVYVMFPTKDNKLHLRRSLDVGASFQQDQIVSNEDGWWPEIQLDPSDTSGASVYLFWDAPSYRRSVNGGQTFDKVMWTYPAFTSGSYQRSQRAVGYGQKIHWLASGALYSSNLCGGWCDRDILYRHVFPAPGPGESGLGLRLFTNQAPFEDRADNMQVLAKTINITGPITAEIWVKDLGGGIGTGYTDYRTPVFFKQRDLSTGYRPAYAVGTFDYYGQRKLMVDIQTSSGYYSISAPGDQGLLPANTWTHVAMTYKPDLTAENLNLYRNGELIATGTISGNIVSGFGNLFVGRYGNWVVDEFRIWNRALGPIELKNKMSTPLTGSETGLRAYFNFDNTTRDLTGGGNDGILMYWERYVTGKL